MYLMDFSPKDLSSVVPIGVDGFGSNIGYEVEPRSGLSTFFWVS